MGALLVTLLLVPRPVLSGAEAIVDTAGPSWRIHYTLSGADALAHGASDATPPNGIPDDVDAVASGLTRIQQHWALGVGMRSPLPDSGLGGDSRIDVYLRHLDGERGLTHPDDVALGTVAPGSTKSAFIELEPATARVSAGRLAAAAGHEAHHAIQYAYSTTLAPWVSEASATYVENADFTGASGLQAETDAHFAAFLIHPDVALDTTDGVREYDAMAFIKFLVDSRPGGEQNLRSLWEKMAQHGDALAGLDDLVSDEGLARVLYRFAEWNRSACVAAHTFDGYQPRARCASEKTPIVQGLGVVPALKTFALPALASVYLALPPLDGCQQVAAAFVGETDLAYGSASGAGATPEVSDTGRVDFLYRDPQQLIVSSGNHGNAIDGGVAAMLLVSLRATGGQAASDACALADAGVSMPPTVPGCGCELAASHCDRSSSLALVALLFGGAISRGRGRRRCL